VAQLFATSAQHLIGLAYRQLDSRLRQKVDPELPGGQQTQTLFDKDGNVTEIASRRIAASKSSAKLPSKSRIRCVGGGPARTACRQNSSALAAFTQR
jgi:hypothetical protein